VKINTKKHHIWRLNGGELEGKELKKTCPCWRWVINLHLNS